VTYRLDGRQYVAVMGGTVAPRLVTFALGPRSAEPRAPGEEPRLVPSREREGTPPRTQPLQ
jgi:hypothetical protein